MRWAACLIVLATALAGCTAEAHDPAPTPSSTSSSTAGDGRIVLPAEPRVYFLGDFWTHGYSADPGRGFAQVVGAALGWRVDAGDDGSRGGFVHTFNPNGALFPDRAAALRHLSADLVVIQGGLNDAVGDQQALPAAVERTLQEVRRASDGAPVVLLGPASPTGTVDAALRHIDRREASVAARLHVPYVSPLQESWINPADVGWIVDPATGHPSTAGHLYFGGRFAQALEAIVRTG